jgi:hypothetical protein
VLPAEGEEGVDEGHGLGLSGTRSGQICGYPAERSVFEGRPQLFCIGWARLLKM